MREDSVVMLCGLLYSAYCSSFFCNDTATTEIYTYLHTLSLHDALPISSLPYVPECDCRPHNLALSVPSLQDVQRTMRLVRFHAAQRSEEHTSELQSLMRISYAVFCLKKKTHTYNTKNNVHIRKPTHTYTTTLHYLSVTHPPIYHL